jgi:hypothetical protein
LKYPERNGEQQRDKKGVPTQLHDDVIIVKVYEGNTSKLSEAPQAAGKKSTKAAN